MRFREVNVTSPTIDIKERGSTGSHSRARLPPPIVLAGTRHSVNAPWRPPWQIRTTRTSVEGSGKDLVLHVVTEKLQWSPAGGKIGSYLGQIDPHTAQVPWRGAQLAISRSR